MDRVNLTARELLDGLMPIRSFNREEHELERFDKASLCLLYTSQDRVTAKTLDRAVHNQDR